jgi:hypothetical protein
MTQTLKYGHVQHHGLGHSAERALLEQVMDSRGDGEGVHQVVEQLHRSDGTLCWA